MQRFKQIMGYALIIVLFAIFSTYMAKVALSNTYKSISGIIKKENITITEVKRTDVNGYAKGTIKNNSENDIEKIYIKIDLYSKRDVYLGTEYLEITNLKINETREFEIDFRYNNVDHYEITTVYEK